MKVKLWEKFSPVTKRIILACGSIAALLGAGALFNVQLAKVLDIAKKILGLVE